MYTKFGKFAATFIVFIASLTQLAQCELQPQQQQQPTQPVYNRGNRFGAATSRFNRTSSSQLGTAYASHNCEYRDLMTQLHDRVGILASLDEDQRNRLENIDKKIVQFEESNLSRLDALGVQMTDINKRIDIVEHLQRMNNRQVDTLKGEFVALTQQQHQLEKAAGHVNDIILSRNARQADTTATQVEMSDDSNMNEFRLDCSGKLESIATLLASTAANVKILQMQLSVNMTRVLQSTGALQRRFNNLARRQQIGQGYPPVQPNFYSAADSHQLVTSCALSHLAGTGGIQKLQLTTDSLPFYVLCDEEIQGGGWTVIHHRFSGEVNFQRDWQEYKNGFGNLAGEFFIGLDKLHALTAASVNELLILMLDKDNEQKYAKYSLFAIGSEKELYALSLLGTYSGNGGDAFSYHAGSKFSTFDNDNDGWIEGNCAQAHTGAWWYNACEQSNLNGQYLNGVYDKALTFQGMYWHDFHGPNYSLKSVKMMIRPVSAEYRR